jgi:histidine triad (HIT) family protein
MEECIFCKIVKGEIPSCKIYEDERVLGFADINPLAPGHTLLIPKRHAANLWEMETADLAAVHAASKKVALAIREALQPVGIAALQLNGRGVNQLVMHYHLHLVPRAADGPPLKITEWELRQGDMELIQRTAERIAAAIGGPTVPEKEPRP